MMKTKTTNEWGRDAARGNIVDRATKKTKSNRLQQLTSFVQQQRIDAVFSNKQKKSEKGISVMK